MARPRKATVNYFPHACNHGKTMFILEQRYGNDGYAFWFKLLERLGRADGHSLNLSDELDLEFLASETRLTTSDTCQILDLLSRINAIDKDLWQKSRIIWSQNFVDNISDAYRNTKGYLPQKPVSNVINKVSDVINDVSDTNPTSENNKLNKSKLNKNKEKKKETHIPENFFISDRNRELLSKEGFSDIDVYLPWFKDWATSKAKTYADWDAVFRNCVRGDWGQLRGKGNGSGGLPAQENTNCINHPTKPGAATISGRWYCRQCLDKINAPPEKFDLTIKDLTRKMTL